MATTELPFEIENQVDNGADLYKSSLYESLPDSLKEVTLKKFYAEKNRIRLQPANNQMPPIYTKPDNVEIQGRVIAVIRQLV